jgi:hypothetical protein
VLDQASAPSAAWCSECSSANGGLRQRARVIHAKQQRQMSAAGSGELHGLCSSHFWRNCASCVRLDAVASVRRAQVRSTRLRMFERTYERSLREAKKRRLTD